MLTVLLAFAIGYTLHAKDVFQPPKPAPLAEWSRAVDGREALQLKLADGATARGWLYPTDRAGAPLLLFFYGSNEDLAHEANRLAWLRDTFHINTLCFDLPGYGWSEGGVEVAAIKAAAVQEYDYTRATLAPAAPIVVYGWSIGTSLALHVAAAREVAGVILQAPPATAEAMLQYSSHHDVPWFGRGMVSMRADDAVRPLYEGAAAVRGVHAPLLVLQGEADDVVPFAQGRQVFDASPATRKRFVAVPGAHHNDLRISQPPAKAALGEFFTSLDAGP